MASTKDLKKRIVSTKNTQQTTKAMKMVSAAKLRRAQDAINNQRPYAKSMDDLIKVVSRIAGDDFSSPLLGREDAIPAGQAKAMLVVVTSDRGLCAGFNSGVIKTAQRWLVSEESKYSSVRLAFVGRKGNEFFRTKVKDPGPYFVEAGGKVTFLKAKKLADALVKIYLSGEADEIHILFNEFKNAVTQKPVTIQFLPVRPAQVAEGSADVMPMYLVKPNPKEMLAQLLDKNFGIQAFRVLLESQAGEHGARMSAMENATKNAGEMIRKLSLKYNKQRQAGITTELLEIIAGSESQKG